jgi:hypothetical protein
MKFDEIKKNTQSNEIITVSKKKTLKVKIENKITNKEIDEIIDDKLDDFKVSKKKTSKHNIIINDDDNETK